MDDRFFCYFFCDSNCLDLLVDVEFFVILLSIELIGEKFASVFDVDVGYLTCEMFFLLPNDCIRDRVDWSLLIFVDIG